MSMLSAEKLQEIVEVVWMTALELPISPAGNCQLHTDSCHTADISISGAWHGVVTVRASSNFLTRAASVMFSCPIYEVSDTDRIDTLTELTNMLGGTVKCLLPETCDLSLPEVQDSHTDNGTCKDWIYFRCEDNPLAIAVTELDENVSRVA